jgi:hypothetical protein
MRMRWSAAVLGAALAGGIAAAQPPEPYPEWMPLPVGLKQGVVLRARLDLEFRRAGGPRRDTVEQILLNSESADPLWGYLATTACLEWVIHCTVFVAFMESRPQELTGDAAKKAEYESTLVRREAYVQGLSATTRHEVFRRLIEGERVEDPQLSWLDPDTAALRALREVFDDLIPVIRRNLNDRLKANREPIEMDLRVREAVISTDPKSALLALIRECVNADVKCGLRTAEQLKKEPPCSDSWFILARKALEALRRVNPPGAAQALKGLLALYRPVEEKWQRDREAEKARGAPIRFHEPPEPQLPPGQIPLVGRLSRNLVEAIGDLGDRDFERTVFKNRLGLPFTLWDRVHEVEEALVKKGTMKASQMVTDEPQ